MFDCAYCGNEIDYICYVTYGSEISPIATTEPIVNIIIFGLTVSLISERVYLPEKPITCSRAKCSWDDDILQEYSVEEICAKIRKQGQLEFVDFGANPIIGRYSKIHGFLSGNCEPNSFEVC